jgi:hypothetical protein
VASVEAVEAIGEGGRRAEAAWGGDKTVVEQQVGSYRSLREVAAHSPGPRPLRHSRRRAETLVEGVLWFQTPLSPAPQSRYFRSHQFHSLPPRPSARFWSTLIPVPLSSSISSPPKSLPFPPTVPKHTLTYGYHWVLTGLANKLFLEAFRIAVYGGKKPLDDWGLRWFKGCLRSRRAGS